MRNGNTGSRPGAPAISESAGASSRGVSMEAPDPRARLSLDRGLRRGIGRSVARRARIRGQALRPGAHLRPRPCRQDKIKMQSGHGDPQAAGALETSRDLVSRMPEIRQFHWRPRIGRAPVLRDEAARSPVRSRRRLCHHPATESGEKRRVRSETLMDRWRQARLFCRSMTPVEQSHIIGAFAFEPGKVETPEVLRRVLGRARNVDAGCANRSNGCAECRS